MTQRRLHIEYDIKHNIPGHHVLVRIVRQSHRGREFGNDGTIFEHGGFMLKSDSTPELREDRLYVRGIAGTRDERVVLFASLIKENAIALLEKVLQAVTAYNQMYSNNSSIDVEDCCTQNKELE